MTVWLLQELSLVIFYIFFVSSVCCVGNLEELLPPGKICNFLGRTEDSTSLWKGMSLTLRGCVIEDAQTFSLGPLLSLTFCHILRKRIPSISKVTMDDYVAVPSLPLCSDRNAASGHLVSFTHPMSLLTPCPKRRAHSCSSVPLEASTCAEGRAGSPLSQTAFPHCHSHTCSLSSHSQGKRGQWPQLFLSLPDWNTCFEVKKDPQGLGQVFPGHLIGLQEITPISFSEVKMQSEISKEFSFTLDLHNVHLWL